MTASIPAAAAIWTSASVRSRECQYRGKPPILAIRRWPSPASHAAEVLTVKPALAAGDVLTTLGGEERSEGVTIKPFGIDVMKITGGGPADASRGPA